MAKPAGKAKVKPAAAKAIAASGNSKSNAGPKKGGADNKAPKPKQAGAKSSLSDEIKLLGGDDADLELINGVDDGDDEVVELEVAAEKPKAKAKAKAAKDDELQSQLKAFMKELGIDKHRDEDDDEEDEDEAEDEDEGAQDADEGDDEPEEPDDDNSAEDQLEADDADEAEDVEEAEEDDDGETALDAAGQAQLGRLKKAVSAALDSAPAAAAPKSNLLVPAIPLWHTIPLAPVEPLDEKKNPMGASEKQKRTAALLAKAQKLWDADVARYSAKGRMSTSDRDFISHVLKSGTATDKISALQLLVQESPVHNFAKLNNELTTMCDKKSRREAIQAIDAVSDLCLGGLLPDRKLRYFADRPIFSPGVTDAHLILWAFEDSLKNWYFRFIRILEVLSHDPLPYPKRRAMHRICELLSGKPEQEQNLLLLLVNKFGDSDRQAPSLASHLLLGLLKQHPAMKLVVIAEVERFIYRPGTSDRAKYYAVTFLDQIVLSHREPDVKAANKLVEIYFELFGQLLKRPEEEKDKPVEAPKKKKARHRDRGKPKPPPPKPAAESEQGFGAKMVAAVLTGVNRAWPYSKLDDSVFDAHVDILFKVSHSAALNTAIQALAFIAQVASSRSSVSDRLARAVYEMLLHPALFGSAHLAPFFNMVYKLVKLDPSVPRTVAMLKRLLAVSAGQTPMFAAAALYLFGEVAREKPGVLGAVKMGERKEDEDEEKFVDVRGDSEDEEEKEASDGDEEDNKVAEKESKAVDNAKNQGYDPYKRDPLYAKAEVTCFWELNELATHYHPTVSLYAQTLLAAQPLPIPEGGYDPLRNHSLMHFLDRFVFKNPRKAGEKEGSAMKPKDEMVGTDKDAGVLFHGGKKRMTVNGGKGDVAVNDAEWLRRARQKGVAEDEKFFLTFFENKERTTPKAVAKDNASDMSDDQEIDDDEAWDAMRQSVGFPKVDEDEDVEEDEEFDLGSMSGSDEDGGDLEGEGEEGSDADMDAVEDQEDIEGEDFEELDEEQEGPFQDAEESSEESEGEASQQQAGGDSDDELANLVADGGSDEEDEKVASKPNFLARKAASLGYHGGFFATKGGDVEDAPRGFATADDFAALLDMDDGEDLGYGNADDGEDGASGEDDEEEEIGGKRKRKGGGNKPNKGAQNKKQKGKTGRKK